MVVLTRDWADVFIEDVDDRSRLERSALFFVPKAFELCRMHKLTVAGLNSRSTIARKDNPELQLAGRLVISTVFACKQPVVLDSAIRFINLVNLVLPYDERLTTSDIIACAFRLRDPEIVGELNLKPGDLSAACNLRLEIIEAALKRTRITYFDAYTIWYYLMQIRYSRKNISPAAIAVLTGNPNDFISTDTKRNYPIVVDQVGKRSLPKHSKRPNNETVDDSEYVYSRSLLHPAPRSGHPWALASPFYMQMPNVISLDGPNPARSDT